MGIEEGGSKCAATAVQPVHIHVVFPIGENCLRAKDLGCFPALDFLLHTPGGNDLIGYRVNLKEKLQLMWQHNPPVAQGKQVLVGIFID